MTYYVKVNWPITYVTQIMNLMFIYPFIVTQYTKMTNKMQLCRIIYYSLAAVHVSSDIFAHRQEHLTVLQLLVLHTYVAASWYHGSVSCSHDIF
jgi:hypothetical protein